MPISLSPTSHHTLTYRAAGALVWASIQFQATLSVNLNLERHSLSQAQYHFESKWLAPELPSSAPEFHICTKNNDVHYIALLLGEEWT